MKANELKSVFEEMLKTIAPEMAQLLPEDGISGMLKFYQIERVTECDLENDGDMLLFQWGEYDFTGKKEFQINITRQLILEDDEPYQLSLTFYYEVNRDNSNIKSGNFWCNNMDEIPGFKSKIENNAAYLLLKDIKAQKVEIVYEQC